MAKYRVLSIDGGGIKGLLATVLLQRIVATPGLENFLESIDLIAGTSTGGLIALSLAHRVDLEKIRKCYVSGGPKVFDDSWTDDLADLGKILGADYEIKGLRNELKKLLGTTTLGQLDKKVLITAFDLDNEDPDPALRTWKPKLFHNYPGENSDSARSAVDVGLYTASMPTYFPSVDGYIDGGVYAANPSMCALAQTQDARYGPPASFNEVHLLSLGTGKSLEYITGKTLDWGYASWAQPLVSLMVDGTAGIADYQCRQLMGNRYYRFAPVFPVGTTVHTDEIDKIPYLVEFAESLQMDEVTNWLKTVWSPA
jgi:uncharacterized protein